MLGVMREYLNGFAGQHYKNLTLFGPPSVIFMLFLNEKGINDLELVGPKRITEFLSWADEVGYANAAHDISILKIFFHWAIRHGHRRSACPVYPKFHGKKRPEYLPRPCSKVELSVIWQFANERDSAKVRVALSIGQQSGLRLGESVICASEAWKSRDRDYLLGCPTKPTPSVGPDLRISWAVHR